MYTYIYGCALKAEKKKKNLFSHHIKYYLFVLFLRLSQLCLSTLKLSPVCLTAAGPLEAQRHRQWLIFALICAVGAVVDGFDLICAVGAGFVLIFAVGVMVSGGGFSG